MTQTNAKSEVTLEIDALSTALMASAGSMARGRDGCPILRPGDQITARIVESKERYSTAELARVMAPPPLRQTPPCPYVSDWRRLLLAAPSL